MKSEVLRKWMEESGNTREWLAAQCKVSKRTVEGWFARDELPEPAGVLCERIMAEAIFDNSELDLKLSYEEFLKVQRAMAKTGYTDFLEFVADAVLDRIDSTTEEEIDSGKYYQRKGTLALVREDPPDNSEQN